MRLAYLCRARGWFESREVDMGHVDAVVVGLPAGMGIKGAADNNMLVRIALDHQVAVHVSQQNGLVEIVFPYRQQPRVLATVKPVACTSTAV